MSVEPKVAMMDKMAAKDQKRTDGKGKAQDNGYTPLSVTEQGKGKAQDPSKDEKAALVEAVVEEEEDEFDAPVVFSRTDTMYMFLLLVLPGCLAILPVCVPLANPFAKDGDNSLATNWGYYGVYNVIGWGAIWLKITLWNCEIWECDFFFPFMQGKPQIFACTRSLASWCTALTFSTLFFMGGYEVFHNPIPFGTITGGVPCYVFNFCCIYIFMVPAEKKVSLKSNFNVVRVWIPFVIWVISLCVYVCLTHVHHEYVQKLHDQGKELEYICGNIAIQMTFIGIREFLCNLPHGWFMGCENSDISFLWTLGYAAMCSTYCDWLFPGMPHTPLGISAQLTIITVNFFMAWTQYFRASDGLHLLEVFLNNFCDVGSGVAFMLIFCYNGFGNGFFCNKEVMYVMDKLSNEDLVRATQMISVNLCVNVFKLTAMGCLAHKAHDGEIINEAKQFIQLVLRRWFWLVVWLLVSTACACGACMIMKHDGMDITFQFKEWEFGKEA